MKPIIFCRIADMKYYQGDLFDKPYQNSQYVKEHGTGCECYNFFPVAGLKDDVSKCFGYVMLNGRRGLYAQLHVERMYGCKAMRYADSIDNVIVVFCSKAKNEDGMRVVGFYKNATAYRWVQYIRFEDGIQDYSFIADADNCVLLPYEERHRNDKWKVPTSHKGGSLFGFGRSNIWYAKGSCDPDEEKAYVERMIKNIESYDGPNWVWEDDNA